MPFDPWRRAHDNEVRSHAKSEYAAEGKSSYPHVWTDAAMEPFCPHHDGISAGDAPRRRAVWVVVDHRGKLVRPFPYNQLVQAQRFAECVGRRTRERFSVVLAKVPMPE